MSKFLNPNVIEIIAGSVYLAASGKEGLAELKTLLQNHILSHHRNKHGSSSPSQTQLSTSSEESKAKDKDDKKDLLMPPLANLSINNIDSAALASSDSLSNRAPHQANAIHPGILTPGFSVQLLPSFMTPKPMSRGLSSV